MLVPPITNEPQKFSINLFDEVFQIEISLNTRTEIWGMSIFQNNVPLVYNVELLGGTNILSQYNFPLEVCFVVNTNDVSLDPTVEGLGTTSKVLFLTFEELDELLEQIDSSGQEIATQLSVASQFEMAQND